MSAPEESPRPVDGNPKSPVPVPLIPAPRRRGGCFLWLMLIALTIAILAGGAIAGGWFWLEGWGERPAGPPEAVALTIKSGSTSREIAAELKKRGFIADERVFLAWLKLTGNLGKIQAGEYTIPSPASPAQLVARMRHGAFEQAVTIPEGWTARQIGKRLAAQGWIANEQAWLDLVSSPAQIAGQAMPRGAEGFCFPDTYRFAKETKGKEILERMLGEFAKQWKAARPDDRTSASQALTPFEVVTLASMIEREARVPEEMPRIASVYLNRLRRKMKLQCCATVYYSLGEAAWARPLTYADLKVDSPYNTYLHAGLPAGPISNPGRPAIEAVLRPEKTDFLFYVYRGDNHHIFSRTAKEHDAAVKSVRVKNAQAEIVKQGTD